MSHAFTTCPPNRGKASFGGSLIIIGSVSNIIVVQQAREMGIKISFWDFARLGIPVTLAALAGLLVWVALAR